MVRVVAVLLLVLTACSVSRPADDASGEEIYALLCANCHGENLEGSPLGPSLGPGSLSASLPDEFIAFTIEHGRGSMPSFAQVLDDDQVDRLVEYIREVQEE